MEFIRNYQRNLRDVSNTNYTVSYVDSFNDVTYEIIGEDPRIIAIELQDMLVDIMGDKLETYIINHPSINGTHVIVKECIDGYVEIFKRYCSDLEFKYDYFIMSILTTYGSDSVYVDDGYNINLCNILNVDDGCGNSDNVLQSIAIDRDRHTKLFVSLNNKNI